MVGLRVLLALMGTLGTERPPCSQNRRCMTCRMRLRLLRSLMCMHSVPLAVVVVVVVGMMVVVVGVVVVLAIWELM